MSRIRRALMVVALTSPGVACAHNSASAPSVWAGMLSAYGEGGLWLCALVAALLTHRRPASPAATAPGVKARRLGSRMGFPSTATPRSRAHAVVERLGARWLAFASGLALGLLILVSDRVRWEDALWPSWLICLACAAVVVMDRALPVRWLAGTLALLGCAMGWASRLPAPALLEHAGASLRWLGGVGIGSMSMLMGLSMLVALVPTGAAGAFAVRVVASWCCAAAGIALALWARAGWAVA